MTDVCDTGQHSIENILELSGQVDHGEPRASYGERGIPAPEMIGMFKSVIRITVNHPEERATCGSGCFVKMKNTYWILTTCHNLLNENDAEKMKDGKGQGIDRLKEKVKENLSYAKFLLPDLDPDSDKHFQLTREMSSKDVICDDRSLVYDSDLDLLAIPCKEPEGFGGAYFQLNLDAVRKSSPAVGHRLHMVHAPLEMSNHEDVDTTESGLYSFGIVGKVIRVCAMFISKLWREGFLPNMLKHEDVDTTESGLYSIGIVRKVIGGKTMMYEMDAYPGSSGAPVFFAGSNGLTLVGIHRKSCDREKLNQGSHLMEDFVNRLTVDSVARGCLS